MAKSSENDKVILGLKQAIEAKKKLLDRSAKFQPLTNCQLFLHGSSYNLNVLDKDQIAYLAGALLAAKESAHLALGIEDDFKIAGYPVSEWIFDLRSKYQVLDRKMEEKRLKNLEDKLHNLLSVDKKVELEIDELKGMI